MRYIFLIFFLILAVITFISISMGYDTPLNIGSVIDSLSTFEFSITEEFAVFSDVLDTFNEFRHMDLYEITGTTPGEMTGETLFQMMNVLFTVLTSIFSIIFLVVGLIGGIVDIAVTFLSDYVRLLDILITAATP